MSRDLSGGTRPAIQNQNSNINVNNSNNNKNDNNNNIQYMIMMIYDDISCIIGIQWDIMGIYMRCCHSHVQSPAKMKVYSWAKHRTKWRFRMGT